MKGLKSLLFLFIVLCLFACGTEIIEKIEVKHPNGSNKKVSYYELVGEKEVLVEEKYYHDNGQYKMGGKFLNELRDGEWKAYFETGELQSVGIFKNGESTGAINVYYPGEKLMYEGFYENGKPSGHWKFYNEAGQLTKEKDY